MSDKFKRRVAKAGTKLSEAALFDLVSLFLDPGQEYTAEEIAKKITEEHNVPLNRTEIFPQIRRAIEMRLLLLCPPREATLEKLLTELTGSDSIEVARGGLQNPSEHVATRAALRALSLIKAIAKQKAGSEAEIPNAKVHIGLGIGRTTMLMVQRLAALLRSESRLPRFVIHALSPAFPAWNPLESPLSYFSVLHDSIPGDRIEFVGVFVEPVLTAEAYAETIKHAVVSELFTTRDELDLLITSLAVREDQHGLLDQYLVKYDGQHQTLAELKNADWVGDICLRPFARTGPIHIAKGMKPVTLFEIEDLVKFASKPNKHVLLLCAPCGHCGKLKTDALLPLLTRPNLRVWNSVVLDSQTAEDAVQVALRNRGSRPD